MARRPVWALLALAVALGGYYLPWLTNPAAVLSANAFDLAEWVGLSPGQRYVDVPLLAPFFLRMVLVLLAWLFWLRAGALRGILRYLAAAVALVLALTLFPPLDFFRGAGNDVNYRQLMALCIVALGGLGVIVLLGRKRLAWRRLELALTALTLFCTAAGHIMATRVIQGLEIPAPTGIGFVVTSLALLAYLALLAWRRVTRSDARLRFPAAFTASDAGRRSRSYAGYRRARRHPRVYAAGSGR